GCGAGHLTRLGRAPSISRLRNTRFRWAPPARGVRHGLCPSGGWPDRGTQRHCQSCRMVGRRSWS
ncbi:MAG: hypothetical protein Q9180_009297, partial [Flavoplaca navasiana]